MKATLWRQTRGFAFRPLGRTAPRRSLALFLGVEHHGVTATARSHPNPRAERDARSPTSSTRCDLRVAPTATDPRARGDLPSWTRVARFGGSRAASNPRRGTRDGVTGARAAGRSRIDRVTVARDIQTPLQATVSLIDDASARRTGVRAYARRSQRPAQFQRLRRLGELNVPCCSTTTAAPATTPR